MPLKQRSHDTVPNVGWRQNGSSYLEAEILSLLGGRVIHSRILSLSSDLGLKGSYPCFFYK